MPFSESQGLVYYSFESFQNAGLLNALFTRHGGCSRPPFQSLNTGGTVGDDPASVLENHRRLFQAINRPFASRFDVWQVHGDEVIITDSARHPDQPHAKADGIITKNPQVTLMMRFADCVPIFLFDKVKNVVGIVHAGWQGTLLKAAEKTVFAMIHAFGSNAADIIAGIGPSIGPDVYEVGEEVVLRTKQAFPDVWRDLVLNKNGNSHLNLWLANEITLRQCGINSVEQANICTYQNTRDWYSHRRENGATGRFAALIAPRQAGE